MRTYIVIRLLEPQRKDGKPIQEFISAHKTYIDACVKKYEYALDGHRMYMYDFDAENDKLIYKDYEGDAIFSATVKSVFLSRQKRQEWESQQQGPLRPEDV